MKGWRERHTRVGWEPEVESEVEGEPSDPKLGGIPWLAADEPWPACLCGVPLKLVVQFELSSLPEARSGDNGLLQLFCCTRGNCRGSSERVRLVTPNGGTRPLTDEQRAICGEGHRIGGWGRTETLPHSSEHARLGIDDPDYADPGLPMNLLHGWPAFSETAAYPLCPTCEAPMAFLFQASHADAPHAFGGIVRIYRCVEHRLQVACNWDAKFSPAGPSRQWDDELSNAEAPGE
jgi:hypothetical protein